MRLLYLVLLLIISLPACSGSLVLEQEFIDEREAENDMIIQLHAADLLNEVGKDTIYIRSTREPILMSEYIKSVRQANPKLVWWCIRKAMLAETMLVDRKNYTAKETFKYIHTLKVVSPRHVWVDYQRIIRDIYRRDGTNGFRISGSNKSIRKFTVKELKSCLLNRY